MRTGKRSPRGDEKPKRVVAYLQLELADLAQQKAAEDNRSISSYLGNLIAKDTEGWTPKKKNRAP